MRRRQFLKTSATGAIAASALVTMSASGQELKKENPEVKAIRDRIRPITKEERAERIERARRLMETNNVDMLFLEGGTSLNYFTGISWGKSERLFAMLLPKAGDPFFIAPKFEEGRAVEQVGSAKLYTWEEDESPYAIIEKIFRERDLLNAIVGVEEQTRNFIVDNLQKSMPALSLISGTTITAGCRSIKSPHEIELMQIANDITREVYRRAVLTLKEGLTERELGSTISKIFSEYGVGGGALVLFAENSAYPHGTAKAHTLKEGDIVLIDGGCSVEGYSSDITRTTVLGKASEKMLNVWSIVRKAQDSALLTAKPGVAGEAIDGAARKVVVSNGYGPDYRYFTHRVGHGIGMDGHEWYYLVRGNKLPVRAGNTFSNEPGIYIPGEFGIRLEDEMLITAEGAKLLLPQAQSLEQIF